MACVFGPVLNTHVVPLQHLWIGLPDGLAREKLVRLCLEDCSDLQDADFAKIAEHTHGMSCFALRDAIQDILFENLQAATYFRYTSLKCHVTVSQITADFCRAC